MSLDATVIGLCASVFDWAQYQRTKGAVKLHLLLDHEGHLPSFAVITEGKQHEIRVARQLRLAPGTICGHRPGLYGLRMVRGVDAPGRVLGDALEGQRRLCGGGGTRDSATQ